MRGTWGQRSVWEPRDAIPRSLYTGPRFATRRLPFLRDPWSGGALRSAWRQAVDSLRGHASRRPDVGLLEPPPGVPSRKVSAGGERSASLVRPSSPRALPFRPGDAGIAKRPDAWRCRVACGQVLRTPCSPTPYRARREGAAPVPWSGCRWPGCCRARGPVFKALETPHQRLAVSQCFLRGRSAAASPYEKLPRARRFPSPCSRPASRPAAQLELEVSFSDTPAGEGTVARAIAADRRSWPILLTATPSRCAAGYFRSCTKTSGTPLPSPATR